MAERRDEFYRAIFDNDLERVKALIETGSDVNQRFEHGQTPLTIATANGSILIIRALLQAGANVDTPDNMGRTPLMIAVQWGGHGGIGIINTLIANGADVNLSMINGVPPLVIAAENGREKIVKILLDNRADINAITRDGLTALSAAVSRDRYPVAQQLIDRGADVNLGNPPPIAIAVESGNYDMVRLLLESGTDTTATIDGLSLYDYAMRTGNHYVAYELYRRDHPISAPESVASSYEEHNTNANANAEPLPSANVELEITNINRPAAEVFSPIMAMEIPFEEVYNDREEVNVVFKLGTQYFALPVAQLQRSIEERTDIHYACHRQLHGAPRTADVDHENPYFLLRGIGIYMVPLAHIAYILRNPEQRLYELIDTGVTKEFTAGYTSVIARGHNRDGAGRPVDIVSADHCQEGTSRKVYALKALRFVAAAQSGGVRKSRRRLKRRAKAKGRKTCRK